MTILQHQELHFDFPWHGAAQVQTKHVQINMILNEKAGGKKVSIEDQQTRKNKVQS